MEESNWRRLVRGIRDGTCVLLLGPEAARAPGQEAVTLGALLVEELGAADTDDLQWAAQAFAAQGGRDEFDLIDAAESFYVRFADLTTSLHQDLAALPFTLCVQTTPDRLMFNALDGRDDKAPIEAYFDLRAATRIVGGDVGESFPEADNKRPLVFGLQGSASDGASLVLTENDMLQFLVRLIRDKSSLPSSLLARLKKANTCLFLGFGFHRWYQRLVLHVLRGSEEKSRWRSVALEGERFFLLPERQQTATYYEREHRIEFTDLSLPEFAGELRRRFEQEEQQSGAVTDAGLVTIEPKADAPTVFLSYDSRDESAAETLDRELRKRGINTWRDKSGLRGGDDWELQARHVLQTSVDYVAVLHSPNMLPGESYARLEINLAMARKQKMPPEFTFVIPCHFLGGQDRMTDLEHLHYVPVPTPAQCDALVDAIIGDWRSNDRLATKRAKQT